MPEFSVRWLNSDRLIREIEKAPEAIGEAIADELERAGNEIQRKAKENLERNGSVQTGALRDSIKVKPTRNGARTSVRVVADIPKGGKTYAADDYRTYTRKGRGKARKGAGEKTRQLRHKAGEQRYYAFAVEYGFKHKARGGMKHVAARPFLMPAAREVGNKLPDRLDKVMGAVLDRVVS